MRANPEKRIINEKVVTDDEIHLVVLSERRQFESLMTEAPKAIPHKTAINMKMPARIIEGGMPANDIAVPV